MKPSIFSLFTALFTLTILNADERQLELAVPFTDNMILQRDSKVPVWGWSKPGTRVAVSFAGQSKSAVTDANGDWMIRLDSLKASREGREMVITNDKGESISLKDALVGEVWFSSGQSNMVWLAGKSMCSDLARQLSSSEDGARSGKSVDGVRPLPSKRATRGGLKKACCGGLPPSPLPSPTSSTRIERQSASC